MSSHLAERRPAPIQATGTPRACAAVSLLDLFHPTPQQGKRAQQRLEAMHLAGPETGGKGNGRREFPFDDYEDEELFEEDGAAQDSFNSAASSVVTAGAAAGAVAAAAAAGAMAGEGAAGAEGEQAPKKKKKKKLKHKVRKLYNRYFRGGQNVDLKNPEARGEMAGALSTFVAGERARQQQQQQRRAEAAAAGAGAGNGGGAGHLAIGIEG